MSAQRPAPEVARERWQLLRQIDRILETPLAFLGFVWLALLVLELTMLFGYNARGEREVTAVDIDGDNQIGFDGTDRVSRVVSSVASKSEGAANFVVQRSVVSAWETDGTDLATTISVSEQDVDGLRAWQEDRGLPTKSVTTIDGSGGRTVVATAPDQTTTTQVFANGLLQSTTVAHASLGQLSASTYQYDSHGRLLHATDARTGTTSYSYFADDQPHTITTPDPDPAEAGDGYDPQTTTFGYDEAGRQNAVIHPDGGVVTTEHYPTGLVKRTSGVRTYPVEYTYDPQGRMKTLTTWQDHAGNSGIATTTWNYHAQRGWLENKRYQDNTGPRYTYTAAGRLHTRTWARGIVTTYGYSAGGELTSIDYSDATPDVTMVLDRLGRPKETTDGAGTRTLAYHASGQLEDESYTAGLLSGQSIDRTFDALHRLQQIAAPSVTPTLYTYDAASRLDTVASGTNTAKYGYLANSPLVQTLTFRNGTDVRLTTTKAYDNLNRLKSVGNQPSADAAQSFHYRYNSANQRTRVTLEDSAYWQYGYDPLGQVTSGKKYTSGNVPVLGHDFRWTYDDIGNRKAATTNGQVETYTPNLLNQYDTRTVPGSIEVLGEAHPAATVTVTFPSPGGLIYPTTRQDGLYHRQLTIDNTLGTQYPSLTITGVRNDAGPNGEDAVTEETKSTLVPQTPETFIHDADGNLTEDARWIYTWDGENRLIAMESSTSAVSAGAPKQKLEFSYSGQSRRNSKKVYSWDGTAWELDISIAFLYDGWNLLAELDALSGNAPVRTYAWGLDLSESMHGAGGIGGLLFTVFPLEERISVALYDAGGNITGYLDSESGNMLFRCSYDVFGNLLFSEGLAEDFAFGFSTKYRDEPSGLLYYGHRYYGAHLGRWMSRDPLVEVGNRLTREDSQERRYEEEEYVFVGNSPLHQIDAIGLTAYDLAIKLRTGRLRKMVGLDLTASWVVGTGLVAGGQAAFFPDTCEIGIFGITNASMETIENVTRPLPKVVLLDTPIGFDVSLSANLSVASYRGSGRADAASWAGLFYGPSGGLSALAEVGLGVFWDPNGNWIGGSAGIGLTPPVPVTLRTNPQVYYLKESIQLPACACYALILQMP